MGIDEIKKEMVKMEILYENAKHTSAYKFAKQYVPYLLEELKAYQESHEYWIDKYYKKFKELEELITDRTKDVVYQQKEIESLTNKLWIKNVTERATNAHIKEQSRKVKHLFPLENIAGYGQLCDMVLEQQKEIEKLQGFVRDCYVNWDCDTDAHKYNTTCRACEAEKLHRSV